MSSATVYEYVDIFQYCVTGGPSVDKLMSSDQIIKINGEDVKKSPRQYVIDLVR